MINKINGIRIFCVLFVLFLICCYQLLIWKESDEPQEMILTEEPKLQEIVIETEDTPAVPVIQTFDYKFIIVEEEDYLTVYFADQSTVYEYTDIRYSDLEDSLRQKIRKGYCIKDEETLFGFLENYSS